jgi:hypothetical protein
MATRTPPTDRRVTMRLRPRATSSAIVVLMVCWTPAKWLWMLRLTASY